MKKRRTGTVRNITIVGATGLACGLGVILGSTMFGGGVASATPAGLEQDAESPAAQQMAALSYGVGYYLGDEVRDGLEMDGLKADLDRVIQGFRDGLAAAEPALPRTEMDDVMFAVHDEMQARMVKRLLEEDPHFATLSETNRKRSAAYLEEYAERNDVQRLPGGIMYQSLATGAGASPGEDDSVVVTFEGSRVDGSPLVDGDRVTTALRDLKVGGARVLMNMRVGDRWHVVIPSELAYGEAGDPPLVGPNEALVFEIELHEINP